MSRTLFRGGQLIDGSGGPACFADLLVKDTVIESVGPNLTHPEAKVVDVSGLVLTPGFIDSHTHDDFALVHHPDMAFKVRGGVTTVVVGNCGFGAAPQPEANDFAQSLHPNTQLPPWRGYGGYLQYLEANPPAVNAAVLVGHGTIRAGAMGKSKAAPSKAEMASLLDAIDEAMAAGCIGMSSGLGYPPSEFAATDELIRLAKAVADSGGIYTSHIRNEGRRLLESIDEAIQIGRQSGAPVVISHLKASGKDSWGKVGAALQRIEAANKEGLVVSADQYPYTAGSTVLSAVLDHDTFDAESSERDFIEPESVVIAACPSERSLDGRSIAEIATEQGVSPTKTAAAIVEADPRTTVVIHSMSEADVQTVLATPGVMIGSDGLPTLAGKPHPRLFGTFARVLGHYARELGVLTFEEAVHRMTGRPAEVFGFADRGLLQPGLAADLVALDRESIIDRGTFEDPAHYPDGISHVMVNGSFVVKDGVQTKERPGITLRRSNGWG